MTTTIITLQKYDTRAKSATPKARVVLPEEYNDAVLQHVRWYLVNNNHLSKEFINTKLCDKDGAKVPDDTTFDVYKQMNGDSDEGSASIYYPTTKAATGMDEDTAAFLKEGLDLGLSDRMSFLSPELNKLTSSYKHADWKASAATPSTYAADMNEQQWGVVMRNNDLLNGKFFEGGASDMPTSVNRARHTAFSLKERAIQDHNITFKVTKTLPTGLEQPDIKFRIPRYQICDSSKVEVYETKSSIADSMAENAFSQTTVEASVGGGGFGVSVGVKAGATTSSSSNFAQSSSSDKSRMHVSYLFPRVEVFLEPEDLEITPECAKYLNNIIHKDATKEDADVFFRKFGQVFVPRVQLGGRLYSAEETSSIAGSSAREKASALKAAASASVSGWGFQASVSASHENQSGSKVEKSQSSSNHSITWHANGGDTLLCNNPPAWCPTVHSYYNWRVMNQIGMLDIIQVIGQIKGWESIPRRIEQIYFQRVQFKLCGLESDWKSIPSLGMVANEELLDRPGGAGGNFLRRAQRHVLSKSPTGKEHVGGMEVYGLKHQLIWEGEEGLTARFKYGTSYPVRMSHNSAFYGVRRTLLSDQYQRENVLYAGLNEEPNLLVQFRKINEPDAAVRAEKIASTHEVRVDFWDIATREHVGWLKNDNGVAVLETESKGVVAAERQFKFFYI